MFDHICLFNSKVFIPLFDEHGAFLVSYAHYLNSKQNFEELFRIKIPLKSFFKTKYVLLDTADNYALGVNCMIALVIGQSGDLHVFMYCDAINNNLLSIKYMKSFPTVTKNNILLTNGPTLITYFDGILNFHSLCHKTKNTLNLQSVFPADDTRILQATCIGQILKYKPLNIILITVCGKTDCNQDILIFAASVNIEMNTTVMHKKLCASLFFNQSLISMTKTIEVYNLFSLSPNILQMEEVKWEDNCTIVCTESKCFIYHKSRLRYSFYLPFQDIDFIKLEVSYTFAEILNLIMFGENKVCLYKPRKESEELQVKKTWLDIQSLHTGDVLLSGSNQMLLLKNYQFEKWCDSYILTDISSITPVDIQNQTAIPDECLAATLSGLDTKYQVGKLSVASKECEIDQKTKATLDSLSKLNDVECNESNVISSFQESLVDILLHKDENRATQMNEKKKAKSLKLENHWNKIINNKWFLCWTFLNEDEGPICCPSVRIFTADQPIINYQKSFIHDFSMFSSTNECTRHVKPQQKFSVLSCIESPNFYSDNIAINAVMLWFSGSINEFENELFLSIEDKSLVQNQLSLYTHLKTADMFPNILQGISVEKDLLCMKVLHQRVVFTVLSIYSNLDSIENMLLSSKLGSEQLILLKNSVDVLVFKNNVSPLCGSHFIFKHINENTAEIETFIENDKQLLLLLQFFKQCLAEDIVFLPCNKTSDEKKKLLEQMVCAMKEETDFLVSAINIHNISAQIQDCLETPLQVGTVVIPTNTFLRIRKALVKKECITDNILKHIYLTIK